jgi:pilus assembly protein CpaC
MRKTLERAVAALLMTALATGGMPAQAGERDQRAIARADQSSGSVIVIPANSKFPMTKQIGVGAGKSIMVQFPTALKDVLVADPARMDAIVQSSNQVFLIAKGPGSTNAFFFDQNGQQILTLEVTIGADVGGLESLFKRLIPGSNIVIETAGKSLVLTGSVRTPVDSQRASDLAREFVKASNGANASSSQAASPVSNQQGGAATQGQSNSPNSGSGQGGAGSASVTEKPVINMLMVEGEEQVMLRVHVAEVSRTLLKQFGINLGAQVNAGNFQTSVLTNNALPLTAAAGLGQLGVPGVGTAAAVAGQAISCATAGVLCNYNPGPGASAYGASGTSGSINLGGGNRITQAMQAMERDGLIRTLAEPNLTAVSGESAKFLVGGEYPIPTVDRPDRRNLQGIRRQRRVHADRPLRRPDQPEDRNRSQRAVQRRRCHAVEHYDPGPQEAAGEVDGRIAFGRLDGTRRPYLGQGASEHRRVPGPQGSSGTGHAVPVARFHQGRDGTRHHRHPLHGSSDGTAQSRAAAGWPGGRV